MVCCWVLGFRWGEWCSVGLTLLLAKEVFPFGKEIKPGGPCLGLRGADRGTVTVPSGCSCPQGSGKESFCACSFLTMCYLPVTKSSVFRRLEMMYCDSFISLKTYFLLPCYFGSSYINCLFFLNNLLLLQLSSIVLKCL